MDTITPLQAPQVDTYRHDKIPATIPGTFPSNFVKHCVAIRRKSWDPSEPLTNDPLDLALSGETCAHTVVLSIARWAAQPLIFAEGVITATKKTR